jgi:hypothetical protein
VPIQTYDDLDNPLLPGMEPRSYVKIGRSEYICWDKASTVCSLGWRQHSLLAGLASAFVQQKTKFVSNANMHAVLCWSCHVCVAVQAAFASVVLHLLCCICCAELLLMSQSAAPCWCCMCYIK